MWAYAAPGHSSAWGRRRSDFVDSRRLGLFCDLHCQEVAKIDVVRRLNVDRQRDDDFF